MRKNIKKYALLVWLFTIIIAFNQCKGTKAVTTKTTDTAKTVKDKVDKTKDKAEAVLETPSKKVGKIKTTPKAKTAMDGQYSYEYVNNDPMKTRIYTLKNGLKIYLNINKQEPRVQTAIAVRAGGKNDPRETTGLAHYLEHMLFKGTDKIATSDWEKEKVLLKQISDLYEEHRKVSDGPKKKAIYKKIDSLSNIAAKHAVPNEYDKMVSSLGAKGTNAYTTAESTVYINDIPANELEKWLGLEAERFRMMVLRLFHTELEVVYEEFNQSQDRDGSRAYFAMLKELYKNHPYQVPVIGKGEHLKNPSMENIMEYFKTYYVPNNMAVCLSGDLDFTKTVKLIDKYFGAKEKGDVPKFTFEPEAPITSIRKTVVKGKEPEFVQIAFRLQGADSREVVLANMVDYLLANSQAGLIDLDLMKQQKVLRASSYTSTMSDYGMHVLYGSPREGQTLDQVKDLLLATLDKVKKGDFPDWLMSAVITDFKLSEMKGLENNRSRNGAMVNAFIQNRNWGDIVNQIKIAEQLTKKDIVDFASKFYKDNYVIVYKEQGEVEGVMKVDKPAITQVEANRDKQSGFLQEFNKKESGRLTPVFLDYKNEIQTTKLTSGLEFNYIRNELNPTFNLYYILDMGRNHDKKMGIAVEYLSYLGTDKYTATQLQEEFYKLGLSFDVNSATERSFVTLSGLEDNLEKGVELFEHILANAQPDEEALKNMVDGMLKKRTDAKKEKGSVFWGALFNYGKYGANSSYTNILSEEELRALKAQDLVDMIKGITAYEHYVFYYGQKTPTSVKKIIDTHHSVAKTLKPYPKPTEFKELATEKDQVLFVDFDMVQAQILMMSKGEQFNKELTPYSSVFGEYFGSGLSSIVFQEIREVRALAYSAFATFASPGKKEDSHYAWAFLGVQADKLKDAVGAMRGLMNDMPKAEDQFEGAKLAVLKKIESERITKTRKFFSYLGAKRRGLDYDIRKDIYNKAKNMTIEDLDKFFKEKVKGNNYTFLIMGKKADLDMDVIKSLGEFKEVSLEELFNY